MISLFDVGLAIAFSFLVLVLGLSFSKTGNNVKHFFAGGGEVPWWISGLSLFMSFFSVGTFVVWGSIAYQFGLVAVTIQTTMCIAGLLVGFYIAPRWNKTGALTAAEFITKRLGPAALKFYTLLFLLLSLFSGGAFLYPVGKLIEVSTGFPLNASIILLAAMIIAYTAVGGLWAVLVTDVLQFVVLSGAVAIVVVLSLGEVGGLSQFVAKAPEKFFDLTTTEFSWSFIAAFGFYNMVFIGGNWAYVQRYTSVATPKDARKVGLLFGGLYIVAPLIWMFPPMIYRVISPSLSSADSEGAYLLISQLVAPDGLMGLILGAMVFATASSVNTTLNIASGVFTNDVYKFIKPSSKPRELMIVARVATLGFGIVSVAVALLVDFMGGIVEVAFSLAALTGAALFLPPLWALVSSVQTAKSIIATSIISLTTNIFFKFFSPKLLGITLDRGQEMLLGVCLPLVLLMIFEVYAQNIKRVETSMQNSPDKEFTFSSRTSEEHLEGLEANNYAANIIAIGVLIIGLTITFLGIMATQGRLVVMTTGLFIVLVASVILSRTYLRNLKN